MSSAYCGVWLELFEPLLLPLLFELELEPLLLPGALPELPLWLELPWLVRFVSVPEPLTPEPDEPCPLLLEFKLPCEPLELWLPSLDEPLLPWVLLPLLGEELLP